MNGESAFNNSSHDSSRQVGDQFFISSSPQTRFGCIGEWASGNLQPWKRILDASHIFGSYHLTKLWQVKINRVNLEEFRFFKNFCKTPTSLNLFCSFESKTKLAKAYWTMCRYASQATQKLCHKNIGRCTGSRECTGWWETMILSVQTV